MSDNVGRFFGIVAALGVLWIVVYWWWEPASPRISFDTSPAVERVAEPLPREPVPEASRRPAPPPVQQPPRPEPTRQDPPRIAVIPPRFHDYTVKKGDTLESIARAQLGSSRYAGAIREANALSDLERLKPGRTIRIPDDPSNIQGKPVATAPAQPAPTGAPAPTGSAPAPATASEYTVKPGDTLGEIAKSQYGSSRFASVIFDANRDKLESEDSLKVGQKLKIPPKP